MSTRRSSKDKETRTRRPAITPEGREGQLIADAHDLAERQIREGTASAQVVTHFLKLGSSRERLEQERLARENELLRAKIEAMESAKEVAVLYQEALDAMREYAGHEPIERRDDED